MAGYGRLLLGGFGKREQCAGGGFGCWIGSKGWGRVRVGCWGVGQLLGRCRKSDGRKSEHCGKRANEPGANGMCCNGSCGHERLLSIAGHAAFEDAQDASVAAWGT